MNEQFYIDWINSLEIPESVLIDKIEDITNNNNILLNIISKILNKNIEEMMIVLGNLKSMNSLKNISLLMNIYFDYNYDYSNKEHLNEHTYKLIQFLKSKYPKEKNTKQKIYIDNYKESASNKKDSFHLKNNIKINEETKYQKKQKKENTYNNQKNKNTKRNIANIDYPQYNYKTTTDLYYNTTDKNSNNKKINKSFSQNQNPNNKELFINNSVIKYKKNSFNEDILSIIQNKREQKRNTLKKERRISTDQKQQSQIVKNHKSLSLNNINKSKKKLKIENFENNYNYSENFTKQIKPSKKSNHSLMIIGKPILKKEEFFHYYQFPKTTCPITKINLETTNRLNKRNNNNFQKLPFLLQNLLNKKQNNNIVNDKNNYDVKFNKNENKKNMNFNNNVEKKEKLILEYLNKIGIITKEQKNSDYLWKILIPDLKDGYIIGKLINLLEKKNNNYLKGITKETFYKVNIYYNWKKIIDFLINRNAFNSIYLYQKNFYTNDKSLFNFLYDLLLFYYEKEKTNKNEFKIFNKNCSKNNSMIDKPIHNKSFNSTPIAQKSGKNDNNLKMNETPSVSEIMNIRKSINYIHRENNSLIIFSNNDKKNKKNMSKSFKNLNRSEEYINLKNNEKFYTKGENISFDKNVNNIISFLKLIGINTSQINFYVPEMKIFKDGILLHQIITQLESNSTIIPKIDLNPKNPSTAINNHRLIINFLIKYKKNFPIELMGKERELYEAKPKYILKFLNILKSIYNNEIYYYEKVNTNTKNKNSERNIKNNNMKINPKNIDKSERISIPLSQELRKKFLIKDNAQVWA